LRELKIHLARQQSNSIKRRGNHRQGFRVYETNRDE
jgi:hypothetical protein